MLNFQRGCDLTVECLAANEEVRVNPGNRTILFTVYDFHAAPPSRGQNFQSFACSVQHEQPAGS
jgi:hypothetical protein